MGISLDIDGEFGSSYAVPFDEDDEVLCAGSLILVDANHPRGGIGSADDSLPISGSGIVVPNIAYKKFAANAGLTGGAASAATLACVIPSTLVSGEVVWQRTARLGLHGAISRTNLVASHTAYCEPATAIKAYVRTRPLHRYYMCIEGMITRPATYGRTASAGGLPRSAGCSTAMAGLRRLISSTSCR